MELDLNVTSRGLTLGWGESYVTAGGEQNEQLQNERMRGHLGPSQFVRTNFLKRWASARSIVPASNAGRKGARNELILSHRFLQMLRTSFCRRLSTVQSILFVHCICEDDLSVLEIYQFDTGLIIGMDLSH